MSQKVYVTKGLPGSGKTTWAKEMVRNNKGLIKRINKDDLRKMLDDGDYSKKNESLILLTRNKLLKMYLSGGYSVIIDDTNLDPKHEASIRQIAGEHDGVEIIIEDFTNIPLKTCIERDSLRDPDNGRVGEKVIRFWYNRYLKKDPVPYPVDTDLPNCIIVDVDGTLALRDGRGVFEWDKLHTDLINKPVRATVDRWSDDNTLSSKVFVFSGREEKYREATEKWLRINEVPFDEAFFRPTGNSEEDSEIKWAMFQEQIAGKYNVDFILDDRNRVVEMWRANGLTVFQVADGDF